MRACQCGSPIRQKAVSRGFDSRLGLQPMTMLTALNIAQLVLYIALLALLGQGLLFVLAGANRETNFFYKLVQVLTKPFTMVVRKITPRQVSDQQVPIATFFLLLVIYAVVTLEKIQRCVDTAMVGCK